MSRTTYFGGKAHPRISGGALVARAIVAIDDWRKLRRDAVMLRGLSQEQLEDCGIDPSQRDLPIIEIPRGLRSRITPSW